MIQQIVSDLIKTWQRWHLPTVLIERSGDVGLTAFLFADHEDEAITGVDHCCCLEKVLDVNPGVVVQPFGINDKEDLARVICEGSSADQLNLQKF